MFAINWFSDSLNLILSILFSLSFLLLSEMDKGLTFEQQKSNQLLVWSCPFCNRVGVGRPYKRFHFYLCLLKLVSSDDLM